MAPVNRRVLDFHVIELSLLILTRGNIALCLNSRQHDFWWLDACSARASRRAVVAGNNDCQRNVMQTNAFVATGHVASKRISPSMMASHRARLVIAKYPIAIIDWRCEEMILLAGRAVSVVFLCCRVVMPYSRDAHHSVSIVYRTRPAVAATI